MDDWIVRQQQQDLIRQQQVQQDLFQQQQVQQNLVQQQMQQNLTQQQGQQPDLVSQPRVPNDLAREQLERQRANEDARIGGLVSSFNPGTQSNPFDVDGSVNRPQEQQELYNRQLQDRLSSQRQQDAMLQQQQQDFVRQQQQAQEDSIRQQQVQQNPVQPPQEYPASQQRVQEDFISQQRSQDDSIRQQQQQDLIRQQQQVQEDFIRQQNGPPREQPVQDDLAREQLERQRANEDARIGGLVSSFNPGTQSNPFDVDGSVNRPQEQQELYNRQLQDRLSSQRQQDAMLQQQQQQNQEALSQRRMRDDDSPGKPQVTLSDLTGFARREHEYSRGHLERTFMSEALGPLRGTDHPLHWLIKKDTGSWWSRKKYSFDPSVQAGHLVSRHSGLEERFALEDSTYNQWSSNVGESQGAIFVKDAVDIGGIPVERRTAELWERSGKLPAGTVASAPPHPGWTKRPKDH